MLSDMLIDYYTDDSMKAIKRKIYTSEEAEVLNFNFGDDKTLLGLNGYPCNDGLIVNINGTNQEHLSDPATIALGIAISHPLLCHFLGGIVNENDTLAFNSYEMILTRSVHNSDNKGLGSIRNVEH
jgi:hypothetical protein